MKGKIFVCLAKDFEKETEKFFEENKGLGEVKFVSTCMGFGGEALLVAVFFEEKDKPKKASRLDE